MSPHPYSHPVIGSDPVTGLIHFNSFPPSRMKNLKLKPQEIPLSNSNSRYMFSTNAEKPFVATTAAIKRFGYERILSCFVSLQVLAQEQNGLDYLQVFEAQDGGEALWFIDDGDGPETAVTALLPSDY